MTKFRDIDWKKVRTDLSQGFGKSMTAVKKGAIVAGKKAGELADEGQRQYRLMVLKSKIKDGFIDLGVRVYSLSSRPGKNPLSDEKVKEAVMTIGKYEAQVAALEKEHRTATRPEQTSRTRSLKKVA